MEFKQRFACMKDCSYNEEKQIAIIEKQKVSKMKIEKK